MLLKCLRYCLMIAVLGCGRNSEQKTRFTELSPRVSGIHFENRLTEDEQTNMIEYLYFNNGAGVAAGDVNNDGLVDLYFTASQLPNRLYLNRGNLTFEDITDKAGVAGTGHWKTGVTMADVNGDGWLDIYVCQVGNYKGFHGRNQLFINQGDLTFKDEARQYGLDFSGFSTQAAFFDCDLDGDLDMYLLNHSVHSSRSYGPSDLRLQTDKRSGDRLYRNDGAGKERFFTDVTEVSGIYSSHIGYGLGVSVSDINGDRYPDIYISNDFHENDYLYLNQGDGTFAENLTQMAGHTSRSSMGNDIGDMNNDRLPDIVVLDMLPEEESIRQLSGGEDDYELFHIKRQYGYTPQFVRNTLQLNLGGGLFSEIGLLSGIYSTDWSWSPLLGDLDNDGWKDLFITTGIYRRANDLNYVKFLTGGNRFFPVTQNEGKSDRDLYEKMPLYPHQNKAFRNNRDLTFTDVSSEWGFGRNTFSNGSAIADLDNDGDLDLVTNNINEAASIYRNNLVRSQNSHYISVELKGAGMNPRATGSRVTLYASGSVQTLENFSTRGFMSASAVNLHFGLGAIPTIDSLVVEWPNLTATRLFNVRCDSILTIAMDQADRPFTPQQKQPPACFKRVRIQGLDFIHIEDAFNEFLRERLIPHSLATEGPALAVADANGDGLDDLFAGGAKGQASGLFFQMPDGRFRKGILPGLMLTSQADVTGAAFFDADGDGDSDLIVVRGGNEWPAGHPLLSPVLLLNNGAGSFEPAAGILPAIGPNASCVRPADFDNDGHMDLFIGSRSLPFGYGLNPPSYLLRNNGMGFFTDVTATAMAGLTHPGMVTGAEWCDLDGDGDPDLVLCGEWMPLLCFENQNGRFADASSEAGFRDTEGLWFGLLLADVDDDGDVDLLAGNAGLNTHFKPTADEPADLYVLDMDNNGTTEPIVARYRNHISYPFASYDEWAAQVTGFKDRFADYAAYADKPIHQVLGAGMENALKKKAVTLETCLFVNNGAGRFERRSLPVEAQFSVVSDAVADDFTGDGKSDLVLAGNHFSVRPSYGRHDASYGWLLARQPDGTYRALWPSASGLLLRGETRGLLPITIGGKPHLVAAMNNDSLQVYRCLQASDN